MKKLILIQILILITTSIFSQTLAPPVNATISSDFGPRHMSSGYDWHKGIDYASPQWTEIETVEGGEITIIHYQSGGAGYYMSIQGSNGRWTYMHLFNDNTNPIYGDWEVRSATLVDTNTLETDEQYIFILWSNKTDTIAEKVLSIFDNRNHKICYGDGFIKSSDGNLILTQGSVEGREVIGLSGESGAANGHPHLDIRALVGNGHINPLYYITHTLPSCTINILNPKKDSIMYHIPGLDSTKQEHERVKVYINSSRGKDLDKVKLYLFNSGEKHIFDEAHLLKRIIYGGLPDTETESEPIPNYISNDGDINKGSWNKTGISPAVTTYCGLDTMYLIGFNTMINDSGTEEANKNRYARYKDGLNKLLVRIHSINDSVYVDSVPVILDNYYPSVDTVEGIV